MAKTAKAATMAAIKSVKYLVILVMAAVINPFILTSCEDDYDAQIMRSQSQEFDPAAPVIPGLEFDLSHDSLHLGNEYRAWWETTEKTTEISSTSLLVIKASHAYDGNAVLDKTKVIDLGFAQDHTTYTEIKSEVETTIAEKRYRYSQRATALLGDGGTECYLDPSAVIAQVMLRDSMYWMAADSILFGQAKVKALRFVEKSAVTRAAEYYVDKENPFFVEITWEQPVETVHLAKNYRSLIEVKDTIMDYPLERNSITKVDVDTNRVVIDANWERCEMHFTYHHKNGETDEAQKNILLHREIITIPEYTKMVTSFDYLHERDNALKIGTVYTPANMQQDGCTFSEREDEFSGIATNGVEPIESKYVYRHQAVRYKDEFSDINFDFITPVMNEKNTHVESISTEDTRYDMARLYNTINTSYLGYAQDASETVKLIKTAEGVASEGWESLDGTRVIYNDSVTYAPVYKKVFRNGDVVRTPAYISVDRVREILSDWMAIEKNANQTTGSVYFGSPSYRKMSRELNGFRFEWEYMTRESGSVAHLDSSSQDNKGRFVEPIRMKVTHIESGNAISYSEPEITITNTASVTGGEVVNGYHVYDYRDQWTYRFGDNTLKLSAPGTIRVLAEGIVDQYWDEETAKEDWYDTKVTRSIDWVTKWRSGKVDRENYSCDMPRSYKRNSNWSSIEKTNTYGTSNEVVTLVSSTSQSKTVKDAVFTWDKETRNIKNSVTLNASVQENSWTAEDPMNAKVTKGGKTYDFGRKNPTTSHRDHLSGGSEQNGYMVYTYGDDMSYTIGGNTKTLTAPGTIRVKDEPTVTFKGFKNVSLTVNGNQITRHAEHLTKYSDGREDRKVFELNTQWSVRENSSWNSIEANSNQSTSSATLNVTSKNTTTKQVNGATFKYMSINATAKSSARLAGSTQNNGWILVYEEGSSSIEYNGDKADFDQLSFNISNGATVTDGSESNGYKVYKYSDKLAASLNGQSQYATAPGTIRVKVEQPNEPTFFPEEWGEIVDAKQTVANNPTHNSYVYTWSLRFKKGYVLPVVIVPGSERPDWNFSYVEKTNVTTYNGGTWQASTRTWVNTTAVDQPDQMTWSREGASRANKSYGNAKSCHWDEDHLVDGHPSVTTNRYKLTINNGHLTAVDTYKGVTMGTW